MIFGNNENEHPFLEDDYMSGVDKCKCLGVLMNIDGNSNGEINNRVNKGRNIIRSLNSILQERRKQSEPQNFGTECCDTWNGSVECKYEEQKQTVSNRNGLSTKELQENVIR
jgi:hypothetical protein